MKLLVHIHRNTTAIVFYSDRVVLIDGNLDVGTVTSHRLVDRVINGLVYQVVKTLFGNVSNVHCRTFANSFQAFKNLDVAR